MPPGPESDPAPSPAPAMRARRRRHDPVPIAESVLPPGPSSVDLHTHTCRSDGLMEPPDLLRAAAACGVTTLALTDHDTLAGYREIVTTGAVPEGLTLVPGVEINALVSRNLGLWESELHILGFGMDPGDDAFEAALVGQRRARRTRFERTVALLRQIGLPIDAQVADLRGGEDDAIGRPTIARALILAGHAVSVEDAFRRIIGHGAAGYVRRDGLGPEAAIAAIRAAGGLPVLAHFREAPSRPDIVRELVAAGLAGLEVHYRRFDAATVEAVGAVADAHGLIATGGSDYHGDTGTYAEVHAGLWVPPKVGEDLLERIGSG